MVVDLSDQDAVDRVFAALADATRRDILRRVLTQDASVSALASRYEMSFAAVQKHVAVLERAQLVHKQRRGREAFVSGDPEAVRDVAALLQQFEQLWRARVAAIDDLLGLPPS